MGMSIGQPPNRECKVAAKGHGDRATGRQGKPCDRGATNSIDLGFKLKRQRERERERDLDNDREANLKQEPPVDKVCQHKREQSTNSSQMESAKRFTYTQRKYSKCAAIRKCTKEIHES